MALYFKCPKCNLYFMDMFGEYVVDPNDLNGDYACPRCKTISECVKEEEIGDNKVYSFMDDIEKY